MKNIIKLILFSFYFSLNSNSQENKISYSINTSTNIINVNIEFKLKQDEILYANSINLSTDNSNFEIKSWNTSNEPTKIYDLDLKYDVNAFNKNFDLKVVINKNPKSSDTRFNLFLNYLRNTDRINQLLIFPINLKNDSNEFSLQENFNSETKNSDSKVPANAKKEEKKSFWDYIQKFSAYTQNIIKHNNSIWLRIFLVFILGILMSLTPCIYPIIPITVGILQMQGSKSLLYNFLLSLSYATGIATTFALFGLTAALTGHLFGQILANPIFVIFISIILIYLALSMFGFYEMYVPNFLKNPKNINHKGSILSAFIFGAMSGSIASPCLSPGLALLLTIVATLANKLLGFVLLFSFGIGLSVPLLIIGTFSSSINLLPQAGTWMVGIKKLFGFMLFAMVFYYLKNILPYSILLYLISIFLFASGIYYFKDIKIHDTKFWKFLKNILGILFIISSIFIFVKASQEYFFPAKLVEEDIWNHDFDKATEQAKKENKKLLIDIGASYCTLCKAIDKYVFNDEKIKVILNEFVLLKVDATDTNSEPYISLKQKYEIIGVPTILIINPTTQQLYKKWQGELYDLPKEQVVEELKEILSK